MSTHYNTIFQWQDPVDDQLVNTISNTIESFLNTLKVTIQKEDIIPPTICGVVEESQASFPVGFGHAVRYVAPKVVLLGYVNDGDDSEY